MLTKKNIFISLLITAFLLSSIAIAKANSEKEETTNNKNILSTVEKDPTLVEDYFINKNQKIEELIFSKNKNLILYINPKGVYLTSLINEYQQNKNYISKNINTKTLYIRNKQIEKLVSIYLKNKYINQFHLDLFAIESKTIVKEPIKDTMIRGINVITSGIDLFGTGTMKMASIMGVSSDFGDDAIFSELRKIKYIIGFDYQSPETIKDFKIVSVNGKKPKLVNHKWEYTYNQQWGENTINVVFQNIKNPDFLFSLTEKFNIIPPEAYSTNTTANKEIVGLSITTIILLMIFTTGFILYKKSPITPNKIEQD
jgi:hypothetical protein